MKALIDAAHAKGMKVFFDIITNHTADVIDYEEGQYTYVAKATSPYKDADGNGLRRPRLRRHGHLPAAGPRHSFPYTPVFPDAGRRDRQGPGLAQRPDDVPQPRRLDLRRRVQRVRRLRRPRRPVHRAARGRRRAWSEIYKAWVDFGIDGFRIDTVKHVNMEFWQQFAPAVLSHAKAVGNDDFFMFGEVFDADPAFMSPVHDRRASCRRRWTSASRRSAVDFAKGKATTKLRDFFAGDDYYTDTDSNAYELPTFLGNHDMGRVAMLLGKDGRAATSCMKRDQLANELMYLTRGQPVVYYGDEQGFIGAGGDKDARQDMFATKTEQYADEPVLGGTRPGRVTATTRAPRSTSRSATWRSCGRPTRRWPTAPRCTGTPATAPASSPSPGSTARAASSTSSSPTTRRRRSRRRSPPTAPRSGSSRSTAPPTAVNSGKDGRVRSPSRRCPCRSSRPRRGSPSAPPRPRPT